MKFLKNLMFYFITFGVVFFAIVFLIEIMPNDHKNTIETEIASVVQLNIITEENVPENEFDKLLDKYSKIPPYTTTQNSIGTGFFIDEGGILVTNYHVAGKASKIDVDFKDGSKDTASLIGSDELKDIAVLRIDHPKQHLDSIKPLKFADSSKIRLGDPLYAIGNPFGFSFTVTKGIVSSVVRSSFNGSVNDYIQTDTSINPGNSGGPLFDEKGYVIGINDQIYAGKGQGSVGLGFAIPSNVAQDTITKIEKYGKILRPQLGVEISDIDESFAAVLGVEKKGVFVQKTIENSSADQILYKGDIILSLDGKEINDTQTLIKTVLSSEPGTEVEVSINRDGKFIKKTIKLLVKSDS